MKISENNESKIIAITIKPGTKNKTEISYNWDHNNVLYKIIFIVVERLHNVYKREADNLIYECDVLTSKLKTPLKITLLDLNNDEIILNFKPNEIYKQYQRVLIGKGMPINNTKGSFGDLIICFNVK